MDLMVSWLCFFCYLPGPGTQQNLGEVTVTEPWLLLLESKWNKKCSVHLVFKKSINGTQTTALVLVLYVTLGSQCPKEQKAPNPDGRLEMQHWIILCYRVLIPSNVVYQHLPQTLIPRMTHILHKPKTFLIGIEKCQTLVLADYNL